MSLRMQCYRCGRIDPPRRFYPCGVGGFSKMFDSDFHCLDCDEQMRKISAMLEQAALSGLPIIDARPSDASHQAWYCPLCKSSWIGFDKELGPYHVCQDKEGSK